MGKKKTISIIESKNMEIFKMCAIFTKENNKNKIRPVQKEMPRLCMIYQCVILTS